MADKHFENLQLWWTRQPISSTPRFKLRTPFWTAFWARTAQNARCTKRWVVIQTAATILDTNTADHCGAAISTARKAGSPRPSSLLASGWTLDPGSMFDTEPLQLATPEMTSAFNDLLGYFADEATNPGSLF